MKILNITQGSQEWLAYRMKTCNASEAAAMLGYSKYLTRTDLLRRKAFGIEEAVSAYQQRLFDAGHLAEEMSRPIAEELLKTELFPATAETVIGGIKLLASFDGLSIDKPLLWENKLKNKELIEFVERGDLPDTHWPQVEHQMLVADVDEVFFTISDESGDILASIFYKTIPLRRQTILDGWRQFMGDLESYKSDVVEEVTATPIQSLPALFIEADGWVVSSNLSAWRNAAEAFIANIKTNLNTEQDFADAEETVRFCEDAEKKLELVKQQVIAQTATIDDVFKMIDNISGTMRHKRLELQKLVRSRKDSIKEEIIQAAQDDLLRHVAGLNERANGYIPPVNGDFVMAAKGKKTLRGLKDGVNVELAKKKIEANAIAERIVANIKSFKKIGQDYDFLFPDFCTIVQKDREDFISAVKFRVTAHQTIGVSGCAQKTTHTAGYGLALTMERALDFIQFLETNGIRVEWDKYQKLYDEFWENKGGTILACA